MPNPALAAKALRAKRQFREAAHMEATKQGNLVWPKPDDVDVSEHEVTRCPRGKRVASVGKAGRVKAKRCYGDGTRRLGCAVWAKSKGDRLIKRR